MYWDTIYQTLTGIISYDHYDKSMRYYLNFHMKTLKHVEIKTIFNHTSVDYQQQDLSLDTLIPQEVLFL